MAAVAIMIHVALPRTSKRLNSILLALFHPSLIAILNDRDSLTRVDLISSDIVTIQVPDTLYGVNFITYFNLVTFHGLLDSLANICQSHVDACRLDPCLSRFPHSLDQIVIDRVLSPSKSTIGHHTIDLASKVNLHDIAGIQNSLVADIRRVVRRTMVNAAASGECNTSLKAISLDQFTICCLDLIAYVHQPHARLNELLCVLPGLSVNLGSPSQVVVIFE